MSGTIENERNFVKKATEIYGPDFKNHLKTKGFVSHWFLHSWASVSEIINHRSFGPRVLDIGCGPGWTSIFLAGRECQVTALDVSDDMLEIARANAARLGFSIEFIQGDMQAEKLPVAEGIFDSVLIMDALHHCQNEVAVLQNCYRALRPGGCIVIVEPDWFHEYSPSSSNDRKLFGTTERGLSAGLLRRSLKSAGFINPKRFYNLYGTPHSGLISRFKALIADIATLTIGYPHRSVIMTAEKPSDT